MTKEETGIYVLKIKDAELIKLGEENEKTDGKEN